MSHDLPAALCVDQPSVIHEFDAGGVRCRIVNVGSVGHFNRRHRLVIERSEPDALGEPSWRTYHRVDPTTPMFALIVSAVRDGLIGNPPTMTVKVDNLRECAALGTMATGTGDIVPSEPSTFAREQASVNRLLHVARRWQESRPRSPLDVIAKIEEECDEYQDAPCLPFLGDSDESIYELDEIGDALASALRMIYALNPTELVFVVRCAEMKARRRLGPGGVKDKAADARERLEHAEQLGLQDRIVNSGE